MEQSGVGQGRPRVYSGLFFRQMNDFSYESLLQVPHKGNTFFSREWKTNKHCNYFSCNFILLLLHKRDEQRARTAKTPAQDQNLSLMPSEGFGYKQDQA